MSARLTIPSTVIILLILASILAAPNVPRAKASTTGIVCIQDPGTPSSGPFACSAGPVALTGPSPSAPQVSPTQIRIGVFVENSTGFTGFDITLQANHAILSPFAIDLTGSVLASPTITLECKGGQSVPPIISNCPPSLTADNIELAVTSQSLTIAPTTGLLFTAVYNITGTTPVSGITVGFQTGCTNTSASGVCVTITNGTASPTPETIQNNIFNDSSLPPWVSVSATTNTAGPVFPTRPGNITLTFTPQNGWPTQGFCFEVGSCQVYLSYVSSPPVGIIYNPPTTILNASHPISITVGAYNTQPGLAGNYYITIFGEYSTFAITQFSFLTGTLVAAFSFKLIVNDYSLQIQPLGPVTLTSGHSATRHLLINSANGFSGNVTVSTRVMSPATGLSITYNGASSTTVRVTPTQTANITIGLASSTPGQYLVQPKGVVGSYFKTTIFNVIVQDFTISSNSTGFSAGSTGNMLVTLSSLPTKNANGYSGTVNLTDTTSSPNLSATCNSPVNLAAGGTATASCSLTSNTSGIFTATLTGTSSDGLLTHSTTTTVTVFQNQTQNLSFNGVAFHLVTSLVNDTSRSRVFGTASVTATNSTTGQTVFTHSYSINVTYPGKNQILPTTRSLSFILLVSGLNYGILCTVQPASAPTVQCFATYNPDVFNRGVVDMVDISAVNFAYGSTPGSARWNPRFDFDLSGTIGIVDISIVSFYYGWPIIS